MPNLEDFMRAAAGTIGLNKDNTPLFVGQTGPVTHQAFDINYQYQKTAADGAAGTATADTLFWTNPYDFNLVVSAGKIIGVGAGITGDPANYAIVTIKTDNGVGGATAPALTWSSLSTDGGTLISNQSKPFTVYTGANAILAPGANLWFNIAKAGSGQIVPISNYVIRLQKGVF